MDNKHAFTGVFIPAKIWLDTTISPQAKLMLAEIRSLSENTGWCYANNSHFAEWMGCKVQNVSNLINEMKRRGMIDVVFSNSTGAGRKLRVNAEWYFSQTTYTLNVPPYTENVPPYTENVPPYTENVTEIHFKYNLKKEEEETRESELQTLEEEKNKEGFTMPPAAANFAAFDLDTAATALASDPLCRDRYGREVERTPEQAKEEHPKAVAIFTEDQRAVCTIYHSNRQFRAHYFAWLAKRKQARERDKQVAAKAPQGKTFESTTLPKNLPVFR
jgi:hypothetical protein